MNVGLIGLGTIGSGVCEILSRKRELIRKRTGVDINLSRACDRDATRKQALRIPNGVFTQNCEELVADKDIQIIVELIGGYEPARQIIIDSMNSGKHVVTANKAVLSRYLPEVAEAAKRNRVNLLMEASVAGSIPILGVVRRNLVAEEIGAVYGILNGTTNFILTKMENGSDYGQALTEAQRLGFAEADASFDVGGHDSAMKLAILSAAMGNCLVSGDVYTEGIEAVTKEDITYASDLGYRIKLLGILKRHEEGIELRVHPTLIPKKHALANVSNEYNAILVAGDNVGNSLFYGLGAGKLPTASAVISDIVEAAKRITENGYEAPFECSDDLDLLPHDRTRSKYYIRFSVVDKTGVLAGISKILSDNDISISGVWVKGRRDALISLILTTHESVESDVFRAVREIDQDPSLVEGESRVIRIEDINGELW